MTATAPRPDTVHTFGEPDNHTPTAPDPAGFRDAMAQSGIGMAVFLPDGSFVEANAAYGAFVGRRPADLVGRTWQELTHPDDVDRNRRNVAALLRGTSTTMRTRKRWVRPDGSLAWGDLAVTPIRDHTGTITHLVAQVVDVTAEIAATDALVASEANLRAILDNSPDGTLRFDSGLRVVFVNRRAAELSGRPVAAWVGKTFVELGYPEDRATEHENHLRLVLASGVPHSYEFTVATTQGERHYDALVAPVLAADGNVAGVIETTRDITERVAAENHALQMATHDPLTGLANRIEMRDELTRAVAAGRRSGATTAVLMLDLDRFKLVNDSLGHTVGDDLIRAAARRIESSVRAEDLVTRLGGDEFVVVMRELTDAGAAVEAGWRIVEAFREPFVLDGRELYATTSIGLAVTHGEESDDGDLLREADTAMYVAKGDGGDRLAAFNTDLRENVNRRVGIEAELRRAVDADELDVWFQPDVDLASGAIVAAEALLRWRRPDGTIWPAGRFIDVAEDTGLIVPIGTRVLFAACKAAAAWPTTPGRRAVQLRVNLSAHQVNDTALLATIDAALAESGLPAKRLCLEITETVLLRTNTTVEANLAGIHARGIGLASDDFGTGYASLAQLRDHPIGLIKIDRSFIADIAENEQARRLVDGTIALATRLGIRVTAEGIETCAQADIVRELGCPTAQGYLFGAAIEPAAFAARLGSPRRGRIGGPGARRPVLRNVPALRRVVRDTDGSTWPSTNRAARGLRHRQVRG